MHQVVETALSLHVPASIQRKRGLGGGARKKTLVVLLILVAVLTQSAV
jgi:hypothetical protein